MADEAAAVWEDVLPGEVGGRPLEKLNLDLQAPLLPTELGELTPFRTGQARVGLAVIGVGLPDPVP